MILRQRYEIDQLLNKITQSGFTFTFYYVSFVFEWAKIVGKLQILNAGGEAIMVDLYRKRV